MDSSVGVYHGLGAIIQAEGGRDDPTAVTTARNYARRCAMMGERCMRHAATTRLALSFRSAQAAYVVLFFFAGEFSALFTCALCLLGSVVVDHCSGLRHDCLTRMQRAGARLSWEERATVHQWEQRASAPDSSSDEADIEDCTRDDAGEALGELLVHLHIQRVLSAKQFSIICCWEAKAGAVGPMNVYALGPNSQTGAYQGHVDRCLGLDTSVDDSYVIRAPGYDKFDVSRSVHDIPVALPHGALWIEYVTTLSFTSWTHNVHPCPMCFCSPDTMHDLKNFTLSLWAGS